jgi:CelD/BcsL family acetyltransferase involved in cellulose biosynthesis
VSSVPLDVEATSAAPWPATAECPASSQTAFRVDRIDSAAALEALGPDWTKLELSSGNTIPFRTFAWVSSWWAHMHKDGFALKDSLAIRTVRTPEGRLVGVAPLMLTERPSIGPLRARCLQFVGADPNMTEIRGVLCEPTLGAACYGAIRDDIARSKPEVDWVRWSGIDDCHGLSATLLGAAVVAGEDTVCCLLELPATWEELHASRPRNLKESLRKCYNSIKRDGLTLSLQVRTAKSDVASSLDDFFRLHGGRARLEGTVRHRDVFERPESRAFLIDVCERFAEQGALRIFRLHIGGALAASRIGFVLGDCLYLYYSGFDVLYGKYSAMTTCVAEAIKYAIGARLKWVNLSSGEDVSKLRWRPEEVAFHEAFLVARGRLGRAKYELVRAGSRAIAKPNVRRYAHLLLARQ